jgi:hypothetical protein
VDSSAGYLIATWLTGGPAIRRRRGLAAAASRERTRSGRPHGMRRPGPRETKAHRGRAQGRGAAPGASDAFPNFRRHTFDGCGVGREPGNLDARYGAGERSRAPVSLAVRQSRARGVVDGRAFWRDRRADLLRRRCGNRRYARCRADPVATCKRTCLPRVAEQPPSSTSTSLLVRTSSATERRRTLI